MKNAVISFSGGLDSTSLLLHLLYKGHSIYALSFDYGQKHQIEIEKACLNIEYLKLKGFNINHKILDISDAVKILDSSLTNMKEDIPRGYYKEENMKSTFVPNRNAIFTSFAYGYALSINKEQNQKIKIALGVHSGDHDIYPDCRLEFYDKLFSAFQTGNWDTDNIGIYLPYLEFNKAEIIQDAIKACKNLNLNFNKIFQNTLTSYNPDRNGISNGDTASDIERILAFHENGIKDPLKYNKSWEEVLENAIDHENKYNHSNKN
ncbi:MAG: 7-cyano-7-deazaguanine synthase [Candidatus Marinimicrobia bacterium]|nr:7-cyano-7-deazaguanine synthase [Candidatus Neomarinimicrobiota bacterium]|tara:strand:- start:4459 stop:5247 length:789 start_codon:yes stop_codon:yes gene_type:complete